jgi:hypothetical protein
MRLHIPLLLLLMVSFTVAQDRKTPAQGRVKTPDSKAALTIAWTAAPHLDTSTISGTVTVSNQTDQDFDQTVIVLAVNEVGKAFALGYQHFTLAPKSTSVPIKFSSQLPPGQYVIHADAIAEVAAKHAIYRARLQTSEPIVVTEI